MNMELSILGSAWIVEEKDVKSDDYLKDNYGYCDSSVRKIVVATLESVERERKPDTAEDMAEVLGRAKRHEIIHAFLFESGLGFSSCGINAWAVNEEMVEWLAKQWPKIQRAFCEADCGT